MSFSLSVALAALLSKWFVCFNAYTTIYMKKLANFDRTTSRGKYYESTGFEQGL